MPYHPEGLQARAMIQIEGDTAYDTDFAMCYTLYHIFKQESIQGRGTIKGRGMIKGRHLALYQIFKTTVFTTKYMINIYIRSIINEQECGITYTYSSISALKSDLKQVVRTQNKMYFLIKSITHVCRTKARVYFA